MSDINYEFKTLLDLIENAEKYKNSRKRTRDGNFRTVKYNKDYEKLVDCLKPLKKLNNLIGMDEIKKNIIDQILFYAQELNTNEMMHTCLTGPPGVGKTTLGKILAELYCSMGFLETNKFKVVSRADLVAGYLGQTAIKTKKILKESLGGVLFVDEAYSLGTNDDSYSKECIDTINQFLSENTRNFIMIIAGYKDELERCFFASNSGLKRRFPWTYDINKYSTDNLKEIFIYQVMENGWDFETTLKLENYKELGELFKEYLTFFDNNGGDTLILFDKAKICHSRRVFGKRRSLKMNLNINDIKLAAELLKSLKTKGKNKEPPYGMYV
jgi:SpoVK/Ycf46/Vps4 family AAA+-type ATPase